jgi:hypothetical protein
MEVEEGCMRQGVDSGGGQEATRIQETVGTQEIVGGGQAVEGQWVVRIEKERVTLPWEASSLLMVFTCIPAVVRNPSLLCFSFQPAPTIMYLQTLPILA